MVQEGHEQTNPVIKPGASVFSGGKELSETQIADMLIELKNFLPAYPYDPFKFYPAKNKDDWQGFLISRLKDYLKNPEWIFFFQMINGHPNLIGCRIPKWDLEHFGFKMASIHVFAAQSGSEIKNMFEDCIFKLKQADVKFVSARINGDNNSVIHLFEENGFRYYDNNIWPVLDLKDSKIVRPDNVRLMIESDLERVVEIAGTNSFSRSHFHSDPKFSKEKINSMPAKWIKTSWENGEPIAIIESDGKVAGYFAFKIDESLSKALGYKYGRQRHLALDSTFRGKGLGKQLFGGTIALMKEMGAEYIDSGYSSKNHMSGRLHVQHSFESEYEEVTLHLWLGD